MTEARIVVRRVTHYGGYDVVLVAGNRKAYLPQANCRWHTTSPKSYAIRRAKWWSEKTGIPMEDTP